MPRSRVLWAALLAAVTATQVPSPAFADAVRDREWHLDYLNVSEAHAITKGAGVVVAVVDTGVDRHPDLLKNVGAGKNLASGGAANGQSDEVGHGTSMAGLIAAHGRGSAGLLGIAPQAKILPVKVVGTNDKAAGVRLPQGIQWAAENGAQVINVSASSAPTVAMRKAIQAAATADAVVVAGSGNSPEFRQIGYPAAMPGVLAVGSTDKSGKHAAFSVKGASIQLCAPGTDIQTIGPKGQYRRAEGTSDSTAIVSGAAALVRAKFPELSAPEVIERLTSTATDIGPPGRDDQCGFGVLNIVKALTADPPATGGDQGETASPAPDGAAPTVAAPAPDGGAGFPVAVVVGGVGGGLAVLAGLVALLVLRRRGRA